MKKRWLMGTLLMALGVLATSCASTGFSSHPATIAVAEEGDDYVRIFIVTPDGRLQSGRYRKGLIGDFKWDFSAEVPDGRR